MKIFDLLTKDNRDKCAIYQNANNSFDFDYLVISGVCDDPEEPSFTNANKSIDTSVTHEIKEVDYYV